MCIDMSIDISIDMCVDMYIDRSRRSQLAVYRMHTRRTHVHVRTHACTHTAMQHIHARMHACTHAHTGMHFGQQQVPAITT